MITYVKTALKTEMLLYLLNNTFVFPREELRLRFLGLVNKMLLNTLFKTSLVRKVHILLEIL